MAMTNEVMEASLPYLESGFWLNEQTDNLPNESVRSSASPDVIGDVWGIRVMAVQGVCARHRAGFAIATSIHASRSPGQNCSAVPCFSKTVT